MKETRGSGTRSGWGMTRSAPEQVPREGRVTPQLVAEVADKVYAMLLNDLRIGNERHRLLPGRSLRRQGGW
jgi:hypothetical protein